ncbi:MAG: hypothetical protein K8S97_07080, partial [Anaerolineae bacterium]|nr:hypothetical protein [Anaerolineae bacterium]
SLAAGYDWEDRDRYGVEADRRNRDWRDDVSDDVADDDDPPPRRPPRRRSSGRAEHPPADLGPLPREADDMRRRRDHFSPHDSPRVARRSDPRTGGRDHSRSRDRDRDQPRARDRARHDDPHYHRDRARRHEHAEYHGPRERRGERKSERRSDRQSDPRMRHSGEPLPPQKSKRKPSPTYGDGVLAGIPTWQLAMIVGMAVLTFLAVAFTCVMLLTVF